MLWSKYGKVHHIKCIFYLFVKSKDVISRSKSNTLEKHARKTKVIHDMPHWVKRKVNLMSIESVIMQKNKATYFQWNLIIIAKQVIMGGLKGEQERKRQKIDTILHLLQQGRLMLEFEVMKHFLNFPMLHRIH